MTRDRGTREINLSKLAARNRSFTGEEETHPVSPQFPETALEWSHDAQGRVGVSTPPAAPEPATSTLARHSSGCTALVML